MSSVRGMAAQIASGAASAGSRRIKIPLMTRPLATDTINAACGYTIA